MPIALTCDCGTRFEVDELPPGQDIPCPECQQPLRIPPGLEVPPRTSLLALFSLVLALVGAFTVVGTVAAVVVGLVALLQIRRHQPRLQGQVFAQTGIVLGIGLTGVSLLLFSVRERLPVAAWLRQRLLAGQTETLASDEVGTRDGQCRITVSQKRWLRMRGDRGNEPAVDDLQRKRELLLVHVQRRAFLDIARDALNTPESVADYKGQIAFELYTERPLFQPEEEDRPSTRQFRQQGDAIQNKPLPDVDGYRGHEWIFEVQRGSQNWRFLIRAYRDGRPGRRTVPPVYVMRAYAPVREFVILEEELRRTLDTIRFAP